VYLSKKKLNIVHIEKATIADLNITNDETPFSIENEILNKYTIIKHLLITIDFIALLYPVATLSLRAEKSFKGI
jgi:hypothetical protein